MKKTAIILRGVSGSGKTAFAEFIRNLFLLDPEYRYYNDCAICCADDFFIKDGVYKFDVTKLGQAHGVCQDKFYCNCKAGSQVVIVANTNTKESDFRFYLETAKQFGYQIFTLVVENRHNGAHGHGVPKETLDKQEKNIRDSLKLR